ncbi:MAG TPA: hypothetical protein P5345_01715 [Candidatus Paceibacterota bacterium]|nr:hypothetical protein [Candidatus Paceibacterota bacterium]HRU33742.1 hypothetical protein [Candidatus Paceibacterota bacterium]
MKEYLVYTGGAISGLTYEECVGWRIYVASEMPPHIHILSPMRGKENLNDGKIINGSYEQHPLCSQKGILCRDHYDVCRAHLVLMNFLGAKKLSIGSIMEVAWAYAYRRPLITLMEEDNPHNHPMVREASNFILIDLDEAIKLTIAILTP